jgi:nicotinamide riboside kinase
MESKPNLATRRKPLAMKVALLGAESTGKSALATALLGQLQLTVRKEVQALPEQLRQFCLRLGRPPTAQEQALLMQEQMLAEARAQKQVDIVLCDSAPLATAIYSELHFCDMSLYPAALDHQRQYDLTFVTWPDFPWQSDPHQGMRDGPQAQQTFHRHLIELMRLENLPFLPCQGSKVERTQQALAAILHSYARGPA